MKILRISFIAIVSSFHISIIFILFQHINCYSSHRSFWLTVLSLRAKVRIVYSSGSQQTWSPWGLVVGPQNEEDLL